MNSIPSHRFHLLPAKSGHQMDTKLWPWSSIRDRARSVMDDEPNGMLQHGCQNTTLGELYEDVLTCSHRFTERHEGLGTSPPSSGQSYVFPFTIQNCTAVRPRPTAWKPVSLYKCGVGFHNRPSSEAS